MAKNKVDENQVAETTGNLPTTSERGPNDAARVDGPAQVNPGDGRINQLTGGSDTASQLTNKVDDRVVAEDTWQHGAAPVENYDAAFDKDVRDLLALTGRSLGDLALRYEGEVVNGQMTLLDVHNLEHNVFVDAGAKVPEGGPWVPANHIPQPLLRSIAERKAGR